MLLQKFELPSLTIKGKRIRVPIIQGGMGIGVSLSPLASAVAREGGVGIISTAGLDRLVSKKLRRKVSAEEAVRYEVERSQALDGWTGINAMVAIQRDYDVSVKAAIDANADFIISGGGLPIALPGIAKPQGTALIPIVSSARALRLICLKWERLKYQPDAVVLEGPLAGGHLGFDFDTVNLEANKLENLLEPVLEVAGKFGGFPVIVAGGIFTSEDILKFLRLGASGVQMGTRFLATEESSASFDYKMAVVNAKKEDILLPQEPGSPCNMPFYVIRQSPMYAEALKNLRLRRCDKGYVLNKEKYCKADDSSKEGQSFCICNGLFSSAGYNPEEEAPLYTVGANGHRVKEILSVKNLMDRLTGKVEDI